MPLVGPRQRQAALRNVVEDHLSADRSDPQQSRQPPYSSGKLMPMNPGQPEVLPQLGGRLVSRRTFGGITAAVVLDDGPDRLAKAGVLGGF
jgi:hypothetical protein